MNQFQPPPFDPHPVFRGGHLQTLVSLKSPLVNRLCPAEQIVPLPDGDAIVLHEDRPASWRVGDRSMLLVHGLSGCHTAPYMLRLADRFISSGICVFRMDMRGCGAGSKLSSNVTHAGRSSDVLAALDAIAEQTQAGLMSAIAVSLGGNQLLRAVGRIGGGLDPTPAWFERLERIAVVAPPLDLKRCSDNMERWAMRPYNYYFIRSLLARAPARVAPAVGGCCCWSRLVPTRRAFP
jgi:predicted alpha/beta-fold hydrolase